MFRILIAFAIGLIALQSLSCSGGNGRNRGRNTKAFCKENTKDRMQAKVEDNFEKVSTSPKQKADDEAAFPPAGELTFKRMEVFYFDAANDVRLIASANDSSDTPVRDCARGLQVGGNLGFSVDAITSVKIDQEGNIESYKVSRFDSQFSNNTWNISFRELTPEEQEKLSFNEFLIQNADQQVFMKGKNEGSLNNYVLRTIAKDPNQDSVEIRVSVSLEYTAGAPSEDKPANTETNPEASQAEAPINSDSMVEQL